MRKNFDPEGRGLCVFLGGYVAISCCKLGEGAVGGQVLFVVFFCDRRFGDDFIVVLIFCTLFCFFFLLFFH